MRADVSAFLTATLAARKMVEARTYQAKIRMLELEGIASRNRSSLEEIEQQKHELGECYNAFRMSIRPAGATPAWGELVSALQQLRDRLDDDGCAELAAEIVLIEKELRSVAEKLRGDLSELRIGTRRCPPWPAGQRQNRLRESPANDRAWLPEFAMAKLARMQKEREAIVSKTPTLVEKLIANE
jgi:hypothetical protein